MSAPLWIGILGTIIILGFLLNGMRLMRGPSGHGANAGMLHVGMGVASLPILWGLIAVSAMA